MNWFGNFTLRHVDRFPRPDWPAGDARKAFFGGWKSSLEHARVSEAEADAASVALAEDPPRYLDRHLPALLAVIHRHRRERARTGGEFTDIEVAREACRHCHQCDGNGFGTAGGVAAYCVCGLGQLIKRKHLTDAPQIARRFRQMRREPVTDDASIDALWDDLTDAQRAMWRREAAERRPGWKPAWRESFARVSAYTAEVLGVDPFESEAETGMGVA